MSNSTPEKNTAYGIKRPDGSWLDCGVYFSESMAWVQAAQSASNNTFEKVKSEIQYMKNNGYTVESVRLVPIDSVVMPKELTAENGAKALLSGEFHEETFVYDDIEMETVARKITVSWTTIKEIYAMAVKHLAIDTNSQ